MTHDVERALTSDLAWREAELAILKVEIINSTRGSIKERALLRAIWAMLYAHYEGFAVFAWTIYLEGIQELRVKRGSLPRELIALSMEPTFRLAKNNFSSMEMLKFIAEDFKDAMDQPVVFPDFLEAESNLWPNLYRSNCKRAALSHVKADEFEARLRLLVRRRNGIAHGEAVIVKDLDEYQAYENAVLLVVHELALAIIDAIDKYYDLSDRRQHSLAV